MIRTASSLIAIATLAALQSTSPATARTLHRGSPAQQAVAEARPLTITKRTFLDPGNVVPVGALNTYVTAFQYDYRTPQEISNRGQFGGETLGLWENIPAAPSLINF